MSENQISNFLAIVLVVLLVILFILTIVFVIIKKKDIEKNKKNQKGKENDSNLNNQDIKRNIEYTSKSIFDFMNFDKIEDNMILKDNGRKYIMAIECQGVNYDLMSGLEKNSVEQGFLQFLNTLRYPIQLYVQTRTVNLGASIARYKQNLYEYGLDIVNNTEKMNLNKNILKKHYYVIISYTPEENMNSGYDNEEIKNMAFSDLYTKAQSLISSLGVCEVTGKVLNSEELAELLYIAYNRDEAEVYQLEDAIKSGVEELYSTGKNVLDKRMREINKEIEAKANIKANEVAIEAMMNQEKAKKVKQREERMNELIDEMAKNLLDENEQILGEDVVEEAKKIVDKKSK